MTIKPKSHHTPEAAAAGRPKTFLATGRGRIIGAIIVVAAILGLILAIPSTRYAVLGQAFKRPVTIEILDSRHHKPVSEAIVTIGHQTLKTDSKGDARFPGTPVGAWQVGVNKKYYNLLTANLMVPLFGTPKTYRLELDPIGSQVTVKAVNKITGKPLTKATIAVLGTTATTSDNGEAVIVLPIQKKSEPGIIKLAGYNDLAVSIQNAESLIAANTFTMTPAGKIYFLSKRTGTINVMKADLDGSNAAMVLSGTGNESGNDTVLLASRDWKYLVLKASRDKANQPQLYLIDTSTDKLTQIDEGNLSYYLVGWNDHNFVYRIDRNDIPYWQPHREALKVYDAAKGSLKILDDSRAKFDVHRNGLTAYGHLYETINFVSLVNGSVVYTKDWQGGDFFEPEMYDNVKVGLYSVSLSGGSPSALKELDDNYFTSIGAALYGAKDIVFGARDRNGVISAYYEYGNGRVVPAPNITPETFNKSYPTYIQSPSGKQTFWYESRDGKNAMFIGDDDGGNAKQIASLSDYTPYGWFTDSYVLVSKNQSELYIAPADFSIAPIKITDYHRPALGFPGYGGGYGGQ